MATATREHLGVEHALLGLLRQRSMHAYEMYQRLSAVDALRLVWRLKQSHLYALLAKLEADGLVTSSTETQGTRPPRRMLWLTPAGEDAFAQWIAEPVRHGRDFRLEFLAKLYFATQVGANATRELLDQQRAACQGWIRDLETQGAASDPERPFERLIYQFRVTQIEAILRWLDTCEQALT
jgi:PadR family transcriptional regulator, regulatory protein AphA